MNGSEKRPCKSRAAFLCKGARRERIAPPCPFLFFLCQHFCRAFYSGAVIGRFTPESVCFKASAAFEKLPVPADSVLSTGFLPLKVFKNINFTKTQITFIIKTRFACFKKSAFHNLFRASRPARPCCRAQLPMFAETALKMDYSFKNIKRCTRPDLMGTAAGFYGTVHRQMAVRLQQQLPLQAGAHACRKIPSPVAGESCSKSKETPPRGVSLLLERTRGIEPPTSAWEAEVLPLNYVRLSD